MQKDLRWKILLVVVITVIFGWFIYPPDTQIRRGLDLEGGIHLVLRVKVADAVRAEIADAAQRMKDKLREENIRFRRVVPVDGENAFQAIGIPDDRRDEVQEIADSWFTRFESSQGDPWLFVLRDAAVREYEELAIQQSKETIENRINQYGLSEPVVQVQGGNRILVQIPGVDDPSRVKNLVQQAAFLELRKVEGQSAGSEDALRQQFGGSFPPDTETVTEEELDRETGNKYIRYYRVHRSPIITGRDLRNARTGQDDKGLPAVLFSLKPDGSRRFERATKEIVDSGIRQQIAIILDGQVKSAPSVNSVISSSGIIEGSFTLQEAQDLALVLRAGALPAGMEPLEERTVGPSLGYDSIRQGIMAALIGLALVIIFMVLYYNLSGFNAVLALLLNILLVLGAMAMLKAHLTLPGIAGIILTIGMAVDANVLIFERIREELRLGKTARSAVTGGFGKAFWTIFDANVTTLIAAVFLFQFGTGPIKGFAITLSIGILASMFTAIFVSRIIFELILGRSGGRTQKLSI